MKIKLLTAIAMVGILAIGAQGSLVYQEDFESLPLGDSLTPEWSWGVKGYDTSTNYVWDYFPGGAANGGIYEVETGQAGLDQGLNTLRSYGDYNPANNDGSGTWVETVLYATHTITLAEAALGTADFVFDYKSIDLGGVSFGSVFLKVLHSTTYADIEYVTTEFSSTDWASGNMQVDLSGHEGMYLQWGTSLYTSDYSPSGVALDNLTVEAIPEPATMGLLGLFGAGLLLFRRHFKI